MRRKMRRNWQRQMKEAMTKQIMPAVAAAGIMLGVTGLVLAAPKDGQVVAGQGSIGTAGNTTTITQSSDKLIINWQSFDIGNGESVYFHQPGSSAIALNRILGNSATSIDGTLLANGRIFLINPNGILFGASSQVNVGGLVASTLEIQNSDFLSGNVNFAQNGFLGSVTNNGTITADGGYVVLMGSQVTNNGRITAPSGSVALLAGSRVNIDFYGDGLLSFSVDGEAVQALVSNAGTVQADGGKVWLTARSANTLAGTVVNHTGIIRAQNVRNQNGVIILDGGNAGTVAVGGTLDASAPSGGDGGFIETSGAHVQVTENARVTTLAPAGQNGTWLIDPDGFTIASSGGDMTGAAVSQALAGGNFSITSTQGSGSDGKIHVNDAVTWSANKLTLTATNDIDINAVMTANGTASLDLEPGNGKVNMGLDSNGFYGRVDFFQADGVTPRGGTGFLTINGHDYTVLVSLGDTGSTTGTDLQGINGNRSGYYALGANIDATATQSWNSGAGFTPIGNDSSRFTGAFDGLGHVIDGLWIHTSDEGGNNGLFGDTKNVNIRNVGLTNVNVSGVAYSCNGGLVGNIDGSISNSYSTGSVSGGDDSANGGLVGSIYSGSVSNSYSTVSVSGGSISYNGGLAGVSFDSITTCYTTGSVSGEGFSYNGGLVGYNDGGSITNSYSTGSMSGGEGSLNGGLVGTNNGSITNSYSTGSASGGEGSYNGGLIGKNDGTIATSYWDVDTSGLASGVGAGNSGGAGLYSSAGGAGTAYIQVSYGSFDFTNDWYMIEGSTRPFLRMEYDTTITNAHQLQLMTMDLGATYRLANDIAMGELKNSAGMWRTASTQDSSGNYGFVPIGNSLSRFTGTFDGGGHVINGLLIHSSTANVGLFGYTHGSIIRNVGLTNVNVSSGGINGGLVGKSSGSISSITTSYSTGSVSGGENNYNGGLVGKNDDGVSITSSYWDVDKSGQTSGIGTGSGGVMGRTTDQMKQSNAYDSSWDFANTWRIYDGNTYPLLKAFMTPMTVSADDVSKTYDGDPYGNSPTGVAYTTASGRTSLRPEHVFGTLTYGTESDAGTYTLSGLYSDQQGYDISYSGTLTINPAILTVTANDVTQTYNGIGFHGGNGVTYSGFVGGEDASVLSGTVTYGGNAQGAVNAGSYVITPGGLSANNYAITYVTAP